MPAKSLLFRFILLIVACTMISGIWGGKTYANEMVCPKSIAALEDDILNQWAKSILINLYQEMGCETEFIDVPARRGIHYFNTGIVDGEVYRLRQVEKNYQRPFLRSGVPLFMITNSLWLHPELKNNERYLIGYIGGVVWMENYIKDKHGKHFPNESEMFQAYNKGQIKGFLAAAASVAGPIKKRAFLPLPEKGEVLVEEPLYHYTGGEFGAFMEALTEKLRSHPFNSIDRIGSN